MYIGKDVCGKCRLGTGPPVCSCDALEWRLPSMPRLAVNSQVTCHIYEDAAGLGADCCQLRRSCKAVQGSGGGADGAAQIRAAVPSGLRLRPQDPQQVFDKVRGEGS